MAEQAVNLAVTSDRHAPAAQVLINAEECKGCGLCVTACPTGVLSLGEQLNGRGYHPAVWTTGSGCTGCGVCFYACPEPGAIEVRLAETADHLG